MPYFLRLVILESGRDPIHWPWPKSPGCFCECWCNHNSRSFPGCWGYFVCECVKSRTWRRDYYSFVTCFSVWRMPVIKGTERLLWLNFLFSQTKWEFQEAKNYTHNTWLEKKLKILYTTFLSWPAMTHQNRLGGFYLCFQSLLSDNYSCFRCFGMQNHCWKYRRLYSAEKKILNSLLSSCFCCFFPSMFC